MQDGWPERDGDPIGQTPVGDGSRSVGRLLGPSHHVTSRALRVFPAFCIPGRKMIGLQLRQRLTLIELQGYSYGIVLDYMGLAT